MGPKESKENKKVPHLRDPPLSPSRSYSCAYCMRFRVSLQGVEPAELEMYLGGLHAVEKARVHITQRRSSQGISWGQAKGSSNQCSVMVHVY